MNIDISKVSDIDHECYIIQIFLNLKYDLIFHILLVLLLKIFFQKSDTELLATEAMKVTRLLQNNMRDIGLEDAHQLYNKAL